MNRAFIRKLARHMRRIRHEKHYKQSTYGQVTACGTAACIAGHALSISRGYRINSAGEWTKDGKRLNAFDAARSLMGLDVWEAFRLFSPRPTFQIYAGDGYVVTRWPAEFAKRWMSRRERKSRIAADLLDAIADGKVKL